MATALHWLVVISYITMFYGIILSVLIADKDSSTSISGCVSTGTPRTLFTTVAIINSVIIGIIIYSFYIWNYERINRYKNFMAFYLTLQFFVGISSVFSLSGIALFTMDENRDAHMTFAALFFSLSYAHLFMSILIPLVNCDEEQRFNGWHVLRICLFICGTLVIIGTQNGLATDDWTFSNFEWLYITTYLTYLFSFWNEMKEPVFEPIWRSGTSSGTQDRGGRRPF